MTQSLRLFALFLLSLWPLGGAHAEQQDVAAAVRGVVRVVIIATNGRDAYFVGHGSGFAVAPDKVLTNAHVVELLRTEKNLVVGIIPSQGSRSYGGRVVAYSPGNDLALIQLREGRLPVATFYSGPVTDGQTVTAIGYPGAVDRAQGLNLSDMIQPLTPVKTSGTVSTGRTSHDFDTILHTAPMAQGNSGGPLVDDCGRVLGVNSFGSQAESKADAEFGFAVSNREIASFLRQAGVQFQRSATPCRSIADLEAEEAQRKQRELEQQREKQQAEAAAREKARAEARERAVQEIYAARENAMALGAILLVLGGLSLGGAMMYHNQGKLKERKWALIGGGVLLVGAIAAFVLRPSFSSIDDRMKIDDTAQPAKPDATQAALAGDYVCHIDETRSRITVSETVPVSLKWQDSGCVNSGTQYGRDNSGEWSRILVPNSEQVVSINSFDPATRTYKMDRYLADADIMEEARALRSHFSFKGCTGEETSLDALEQMQRNIRAILPPQPNERLVYSCSRVEAE